MSASDDVLELERALAFANKWSENYRVEVEELKKLDHNAKIAALEKELTGLHVELNELIEIVGLPMTLGGRAELKGAVIGLVAWKSACLAHGEHDR